MTLTILTAPGQLSPETSYLIEDQYDDNEVLLLQDGLTLNEGAVINGVRHFYLMTPFTIEENLCKRFIKRTKKVLKRSGLENFKVILLPEGLTPKVI